MANITKLIQTRVGTVNTQGNVKTYSEDWQLFLDVSASQVAADVIIQSLEEGNVFAFPVNNQIHDDSDSLRAIDYQVSKWAPTETMKYKVTVGFTNQREDINTSQDPLDAPANVSYQAVDKEVIVEIDTVTGDAITNSAGRPFSPPITETIKLIRITVTRNESSYNTSKLQKLMGKTNKGSMGIDGYSYKDGDVYMESINGSNQFDQKGEEYFVVTYTMTVNTDGFSRKFIDAGFEDRNGRSQPTSIGGRSSTASKLRNGEFLNKDSQSDPTIFEVVEFNTIEQATMSTLRL